MRRLVIFGALAGIGILALRARVPQLHERLTARCEGMLDRMPDTFPPKKMLRGIEETRADTARILELLETRRDEGHTSGAPGTPSVETVHH